MHKVEDLKIWQKSIDLAKEVYKVVADLPNDEKYGLSSQIKRCTISIASNIAEGAGRNSQKEFKHFLGIANGSSYELNLITKQKIEPILNLIIEIQKMSYSFQKSII